MVFGKSKLEIKVGIFVFIGLAILITFVLLIGDFKTAASGYPVNFAYTFINGVKVGAPIRFAGMDCGEVKAIKAVYSPDEKKMKVQIYGWVRKEIKIPKDSTVWVNTLGLLGEKYIEIMPGQNYADCVSPNETMAGIDPIAMHEMVRLAMGLTTSIDEGIARIKNKEGTVGKLLYDDAIYKELEALIIDIRKHPWKLFWKTKDKPEKKKR